MSQNYSETDDQANDVKKEFGLHRWWMVAVLPAWVFIGFFTSELVISGLFWALVVVEPSIKSYNESVLSATLAAAVYLLTLGIVVVLPALIRKAKVNLDVLGITRWPKWSDIFVAPAGFVVYLLLSTLLVLAATQVLPGFNLDQPQETGFENLVQSFEYIVAFITLVIIAPVAEELLFRGYLFGKLKQYVPVWAAIVATSLLFGLVHGSWNVGIDTFALSVILCYLRQTTGSIWASVLLHMIKNGVAFYFLFIYPALLT